MAHKYYPHLFEPLYVGKQQVEFKNRIFMAPMSTEPDPASHVMLDDSIEFYAKRARGGAGCVHVGETRFDLSTCASHPAQLDLTDIRTLPQLNKFNNYAHAYGARTSVELNHSGHFAIPEFNDGKTIPISAVDRVMPNGQKVRAMTEDDMNYVADIVAKGVHMAWRGGFDMVCLHYGHGWLFGGWLSPLINTRTDGHGGSRENRIKFPRMVLERVRQKMGSNILIELRMSGSEMSPGGIEIEDTIYYIKELEDLADLVHISAATRFDARTRGFMHPSCFIAHGHNAAMSEQVKKAGVKIPVGVVGGINTPELAEEIIASGKADYVLMGRQWIADEEWANKARAGRADDIRTCIRCNNCCDGAMRKAIADAVLDDESSTWNFTCAVNPTYGSHFYKEKFPPAGCVKKVAVIGGGPAGLEAALEANARGHEVTLFERSDKLGGQLNLFADRFWFKDDVANFRNYLIKQVRDAAIKVRLNCEATAEQISRMKFDAVIVAVGSEAAVPPIPGVEKPHVLQGVDVFGREEQLGKRVVIIGGGQVGCEMAVHLGEHGCIPTVVEMEEHIARDANLGPRMMLLRQLGLNPDIQIKTKTRCLAIEDDGVLVSTPDGEERLPADSVLLCTGRVANAAQRDSFRDTAFDVIPVGDCKKPGMIKEAVHDGFDAALSLHRF